MTLRVNSNIAAFNAYRNLSMTDLQMSKSLEKLSSGYRINRAADDAAGVSVSEELRSQIGGPKVAVRNAQNGISVVQTAEGALTEVQSILHRMRELSVQAADTGAQDTDARQAAQTELTQLNSELDRIGRTTSFGHTKLLDGSYGTQAAHSDGAQIGALAATDIAATDTIALTLGGTAAGAYAVVMANTGGKAYTADAAGAAALQANLQLDLDAADDGAVAPAVKQSLTGKITAKVSYDVLTGKNQVSFTRTDAASTNDTLATVENGSTIDFGAITDHLSTGSGGVFQVGGNNSANDRINVSIGAVDSSTLGTTGIDLVNNAGSAIDIVDAAVKTVSAARSSLGDYQNRFEHTINNLNVAVENLSTSESRIVDTDMASEMVDFARSRILGQAGTSMLAQANQTPRGVLTLLR